MIKGTLLKFPVATSCSGEPNRSMPSITGAAMITGNKGVAHEGAFFDKAMAFGIKKEEAGMFERHDTLYACVK